MLGNRLTQGRLAHRVSVAQAARAQGLFAAGDNAIPYRQRKGVQVRVVGAKGAQGRAGFARKWRVGQALARVRQAQRRACIGTRIGVGCGAGRRVATVVPRPTAPCR